MPQPSDRKHHSRIHIKYLRWVIKFQRVCKGLQTQWIWSLPHVKPFIRSSGESIYYVFKITLTQLSLNTFVDIRNF
jgi:hypothetical protein